MKKRIDPGYLISLLLSVVLAFVIGAVILAIAGFSPGKAYLAMLNGAFSSARHIGDLLEYAMVLCLCGLACVLGARVGIFNVGGEGQLLLGAIVACQVGVWLDGLTPWLVLPLAALAAMAAGGLYALIPGVLKVKVKVNEVITTIMLNTVAASFCQYLAKGPWKNANKNMVAATEQLNARYWFGGLIGGFLGCCGFLCRGSRLVLSSGQGRLQGAQLLLQRGSRLAQFGLHVPDVVVVVLAAGVSQRRPDQEKRQNSVDKNSLHSLWIKLFELNKIVSECVSPPP